jgi:hypothetical protein
MPKKDHELDKKLQIVSQLIKLFWPERFLFLGVNIFSVFVIILAAAVVFLKGNMSWVTFLGLFGPAGVITFNTGRILTMWNKALDFIAGKVKS